MLCLQQLNDVQEFDETENCKQRQHEIIVKYHATYEMKATHRWAWIIPIENITWYEKSGINNFLWIDGKSIFACCHAASLATKYV